MTETTPTTDSIQRCRDVLATASALGMAVEVIPGTTAYEAHISDSTDPVDWSLGIFPDRASAQRALAQWAIREMAESGNAPWLPDATSEVGAAVAARLNAWLQNKTPAEIIEHYAELSSDILSVNEATINRALSDTHIPLTAREVFAPEA
jgi:hypothetical protein